MGTFKATMLATEKTGNHLGFEVLTDVVTVF
jgi:hypothetical protein